MISLTNPSQGRFGTAVFVTQDGLTAEGDGDLSYVSENVGILDLRDSLSETPHLAPEPDPVLFVSLIQIGHEKRLLLGMAKSTSDAMGRSGFIGAAVLVDYRDADPASHIRFVDTLYNDWLNYFETSYRKVRHSHEIGFLKPMQDAPLALKRLSAGSDFPTFSSSEERDSWKAAFNLAARLAKAKDEDASAVILWPMPSDLHPELDELLTIKLEERAQESHAARMRKIKLKQEEAKKQANIEAQFQTQATNFERSTYPNYVSERQRRFHERTSYLEPRPPEITVEYEDYLIRVNKLCISEMSLGSHFTQPAPIPENLFDKAMSNSTLSKSAIVKGRSLHKLLDDSRTVPFFATAAGIVLILTFLIAIMFVGSENTSKTTTDTEMGASTSD